MGRAPEEPQLPLPLPPVSPRPPVCWLCKGRGWTTVAVSAPDSAEVRVRQKPCPELGSTPDSLALHPGAP